MKMDHLAIFTPIAGTPRGLRGRHPSFPGRPVFILLAIPVLVVAWLGAILLTDLLSFVVIAPRAHTGFEAFLTLGLLFGAFILAVIPRPDGRLRWLAVGMLILALGAFGFGFIRPIMDKHVPTDSQLYGVLVIRSAGTAVIAVGMVPARPPRLRPRTLVAILTGTIAAAGAAVLAASRFPLLVRSRDDAALISASSSIIPGTTPWHWIFATVPLALGVAATAGAIRHLQGEALGQWIIAALLLLIGAHLHIMFWPPISDRMLTTSSILRLTFTLTILNGGLLELRQLLMSRTRLLAAEQRHTRQLEELARLKDDFTAMVSHELTSPLGAIAALSEVVIVDDLPGEDRANAVVALRDEIHLLHTLVADVQATIGLESEEFQCRLRSTPTTDLVERAVAFARTLDIAHHPLTIDATVTTHVLADPDRIGQVLRNLISNAVGYTPAGTPITLRIARQADRHVRIEVADQGPGISIEDQARIFGKYERGLHHRRSVETGRGLGLYLSRSILRMHQSDLTLDSAPGHGACFSFVLRQAP